MKKLLLVLVSVSCVILLTLKVTGQAESGGESLGTTDVEPAGVSATPFVALPPPATQLEKLAAAKETVVTKGYAKIGETNGDDGSVIRISAVEVAAAGEPQAKRGLLIQVHQTRRVERSAVAFVDEDEIDQLTAAIDAIAKVHPAGSSPFTDVDASYRSRGDLEIINVNNGGSRTAGIRCTQILRPGGQIVWATAYLRVSRLDDFAHQLATAKQTLAAASKEQK